MFDVLQDSVPKEIALKKAEHYIWCVYNIIIINFYKRVNLWYEFSRHLPFVLFSASKPPLIYRIITTTKSHKVVTLLSLIVSGIVLDHHEIQTNTKTIDLRHWHNKHSQILSAPHKATILHSFYLYKLKQTNIWCFLLQNKLEWLPDDQNRLAVDWQLLFPIQKTLHLS